MNSWPVFLYKHVKTCEPLMKCSILEARGSYKRSHKQEDLCLALGPSYAGDSFPLSEILSLLRTKWAPEVTETTTHQRTDEQTERKQGFSNMLGLVRGRDGQSQVWPDH